MTFDSEHYSFLRPPVIVAKRIAQLYNDKMPLPTTIELQQRSVRIIDEDSRNYPLNEAAQHGSNAWLGSTPVFFRHLRFDRLSIEFNRHAAWYLPGVPEDRIAGVPDAFRELERDILRIVSDPKIIDPSLSNWVSLTLGPTETKLIAQPETFTPTGPRYELRAHPQSLKFRQALGAWYLGIESLRLHCILPAVSSAHEALARLTPDPSR
jgi:hypothetical protein